MSGTSILDNEVSSSSLNADMSESAATGAILDPRLLKNSKVATGVKEAEQPEVKLVVEPKKDRHQNCSFC